MVGMETIKTVFRGYDEDLNSFLFETEDKIICLPFDVGLLKMIKCVIDEICWLLKIGGCYFVIDDIEEFNTWMKDED